MLSERGERDAALADFNRALTLNPRFALAYYNRAFIKLDQHDYAAAVADLDRVIEIDKKHAAAYNNRGYARTLMGNHEGAISDFNRAIKLDPRHTSAWSNRGSLRFAQGDFDGAIAEYALSDKSRPFSSQIDKRPYFGICQSPRAQMSALALSPHASRRFRQLQLSNPTSCRFNFATNIAPGARA